MKTFDRYPYLKHSTVEDMTFKPAHKEATNAPGQVRHEEQGHHTLSEYIRSINRAQAFDDVAREQKITFEEWFNQWNKVNNSPNWASNLSAKEIWNAALAYGKV